MRFFSPTRRDPLVTILVAIAVLIVLFMGFELLKGLHKYRVFQSSPLVEKQSLAGVLTAVLSEEGLDITGWAPPQATIRISDHDTVLGAATADAEGKWVSVFTYEKHGKNLQNLDMAYKEKDGADIAMGTLDVFSPGREPEDGYVWWESGTPRLLQTPTAGDDGDLFLALALQHEGQPAIFAGRGAGGSLVQVYADNELIGVVPVASNGGWSVFPALKPDKKTIQLRFDEIQGLNGVVERRIYRFDWNDGKDNWILNASANGQKETISIFKPEAGEALSPDDMIAGQVIPLLSQSKDASH